MAARRVVRRARLLELAKNQKLTLEYILIAGVNDSLEQAAMLARHARRMQRRST